jgi:hypothetical protein
MRLARKDMSRPDPQKSRHWRHDFAAAIEEVPQADFAARQVGHQ